MSKLGIYFINFYMKVGGFEIEVLDRQHHSIL
jgi:hypothetical protein